MNVPGGCYWTSPASQLTRWDVNPGEVAGPGETANLKYDFLNIHFDQLTFKVWIWSNLEIIAIAVVVLQSLVINHINDWHHKCLWVLLDSEIDRH